MPDVVEQLERYGTAVERAARAGSVVDPLGAVGARRPRVRVVAIAAALVIVLVVIGTTWVVRAGGGSSTRLSTAQSGADAPDGWKLIDDRGAGLRISVPDSWTRLDTVEARVPGAPREVLTVGTEPLERTGVLVACSALSPDLQAVDRSGTWVSLFEYPADGAGPDYVLPTGERGSGISFLPRPARFAAAQPGVGTCPDADPPRAFDFVFFQDGGRRFVARIVTVGPVGSSGGADLVLGFDVLDTLRVTPLAGDDVETTPAPTAVAATTAPTPPSTAAVGGPGAAPDPATDATPEAAARQVFLTWLDAGDRDAMDDIIEDYASIGDAHREGIAQHTPSDLAQYSGRVEAVRVLDDTHVSVTYTVLHGGSPAYANQAGMAVMVNGRWLVSRETVCALLGYGGITCPPRA